MSLSAEIREQLLSSFRAELAEHLQTMTDGILALEQQRLADAERQTALETIFRAAHSLKGAARAVGATAVEQLAHGLESALDGLRGGTLAASPAMFSAFYTAMDAIRVVQAAYEAGEVSPPIEALHALTGLAQYQPSAKKPATATEKLPVTEKPVDNLPPASQSAAPLTTQRIEAACAERLAGILDESEIPPTAETAPALAAAQPIAEKLPAAEKLTSVYHTATNDETVRVSVSKLDALMAELSELLVTKMRIEQRRAQIHQFQEFIGLWQKEWLNARSAYGRLNRQQEAVKTSSPTVPSGVRAENRTRDLVRLMEFTGVTQDHLRQMGAWVNELEREYTNDGLQMGMIIDRLEEDIKRVRMLPLSTITGSFPRMVRDLAQELGREAQLKIQGGETELDKQVLEGIKDPLVHLLRNAIDHGIEPPEVREAAGKTRAGRIYLSAEQQGKDVILSIADDGAGLDLEGIRQALARKNGAGETHEKELASKANGAKDTAQAPEAVHGTNNEMDLIEAIFQNGVSTRAVVTGISGRGVGLNVVRRNIEGLNGRIEVETRLGQGTTFRMILPLRLTGSHGLLVRAAGQLFLLPMNAIERLLSITPAEVLSLEGRDTLLYHDSPIPLVPLETVLELPPSAPKAGASQPVVILALGERRMAFRVDELAGEQEVVIKDLGSLLRRVGGIAGASVMGNGEVVLILHPGDLLRMALRSGSRPRFSSESAPSPASPVAESIRPAHQRILVVDDSITTRTLEKNILEAAGYSVQVATDGEEVMSLIATEGAPDLLISDVTMPRMNGFELTRRIKSDPQLAGIPVILVTSLESSEDKAHGIEVGADAYIVKGRFDQNHLLETVEQLI